MIVSGEEISHACNPFIFGLAGDWRRAFEVLATQGEAISPHEIFDEEWRASKTRRVLIVRVSLSIPIEGDEAKVFRGE
jgi:hypothetical protein